MTITITKQDGIATVKLDRADALYEQPEQRAAAVAAYLQIVADHPMHAEYAVVPDATAAAIRAFLDWGEQSFGTAQQGYFSGHGFAARCLRAHLEWLERSDVLKQARETLRATDT